MFANDFANVISDQSASRVYSTATSLDSPLIADGLDEMVAKIRKNQFRGYNEKHVRNMLRQNKQIDSSFENETIFDISPSHSKWTIELVSPELIVEMANTFQPTENLCLKFREYLAVALDTQSLHDKIVDSILKMPRDEKAVKGVLSILTLIWLQRDFALSDHLSTLESNRMLGQRTALSYRFETICCDSLILSERFCCFLNTRRKNIFFGTYDMLLSILDICRVRSRAYYAADLYYPGSQMRDAIERQIKWQEEWISLFGNEGFALLKQTESLAKTYVSLKTDPDTIGDNSYIDMWEKIRDKVEKLGKKPIECTTILDRMRKLYEENIEQCSTTHIVELFGLQKTSGYPFIFVERGGKAAAEASQESLFIKREDITELRNAWRTMFLIGFIRKEKKWPKILFDDLGRATKLWRQFNSSSINLTFSDIEDTDWNHVTFLKNFDYDFTPNYLQLMDDKSISNLRSELMSYWDPTVDATTNRRLLIELLKRETFNVKDLIEIAEEDSIFFDWLVIVLYPKEKELKPDARMFAMMVLEMRTIFASSEHNVAKTIFPFISAQTMTKSKKEIVELLSQITTPETRKSLLMLIIEADLSRWNLRWRGRVIDPIGHDLNCLFGMRGIFTTAHTFFSKCKVVVRTKQTKPDIDSSNEPRLSSIVYDNWKGGIEGIQQKIWSLATYAMISLACKGEKCSFTLIGQGDNQVLVLKYLRDPLISEIDQFNLLKRRMTAKLENSCRKVGQILKPDECVVSRTTLTYSKEVWINGAHYPLSVKMFAKTNARTNIEIPTLCGEVSALHASMVAAAEHSRRPLRTYSGCIFFSALHLQTRYFQKHAAFFHQSLSFKRPSKNISADYLVKILWTPACFGGFSISILSDYLCRGNADPTSSSVALVYVGAERSSVLSPLRSFVESLKWTDEKPDRKLLLQDPFGLPRKTVRTSAQEVKALTKEFISDMSNLQEFKVFSSLGVETYIEELEECLLQMTPFYPTIARDVFDCSVGHEIRELQGMMVMTQTIQSASKEAGMNTPERMLGASGSEFIYRFELTKDCPSRRRREKTSSKEIFSKTDSFRSLWGSSESFPHGMTSITPLSCPIEYSTDVSQTSGIKLISFVRKNMDLHVGDESIYLGSETKMTRSELGFRLVGDSTPLKALKRLRTLITLPGSGKKYHQLLQQIAETRGENVGQLDKLAGGVISSRFDHRYHARDDERGAYIVGSPTITTHCLFYTEEISGMSNSPDDYPVMFQEFFAFLVGLFREYVARFDEYSGYLEITLCLKGEDFEPLPNLDFDIPYTIPQVPNLSEIKNTYIYDPHVWRLELTGVREYRFLMHSVSVDDLTLDQKIESTSIAALLSLSPSTIFKDTISNRESDEIKNVKLDIHELQTIGCSRLISLTARVIAIIVCSKIIPEIQQHRSAGRREIYLRRLCAMYARSLVAVIDTIHLSQDPSSERLFIGSSHPKYDNMFSPIKVLSGLLFRDAQLSICDLSMISNRRFIYASERGGSVSSSVISIFGKCLMSASGRGVNYNDLVLLSNSRKMRSFLSPVSEEYRMSCAMKVVKQWLGLGIWSRSERELLTELQRGQLIVYVESDYRALLREHRFLHLDASKVLLVEYGDTEIGDKISSDPSEWIDKTLIHPSDQSIFTDPLYWRAHAFVTTRGSHFIFWRSVIRMLSIKNWIIIGVGYGSAAAACLDFECTSVRGLDLNSDHSLRALKEKRKPVALSTHSSKKKFDWHSAMFIRDGNFKEKKVKDSVLDSIPDDSCLVIDIQPYPTIEETISLVTSRAVPIRCLARRFVNSGFFPSELNTWTNLVKVEKFFVYSTTRGIQYFTLFTTGESIEITTGKVESIETAALIVYPRLSMPFSMTIRLFDEWIDYVLSVLFLTSLSLSDTTRRYRALRALLETRVSLTTTKEWINECSLIVIYEWLLIRPLCFDRLRSIYCSQYLSPSLAVQHAHVHKTPRTTRSLIKNICIHLVAIDRDFFFSRRCKLS